jgi:hypothetical protein
MCRKLRNNRMNRALGDYKTRSDHGVNKQKLIKIFRISENLQNMGWTVFWLTKWLWEEIHGKYFSASACGRRGNGKTLFILNVFSVYLSCLNSKNILLEFFFLGFLGCLETESTVWPIVLAPDDRWWMWISRWNENWLQKQKYSEKTCPSAILSTINPT